MSCLKKQNSGFCSHHTCGWSDETGFECVDVIGGFCEIGEDCVNECPHSFPKKLTEKVVELFEEHYGE